MAIVRAFIPSSGGGSSATSLNRVVAVSGVYPARPSPGLTDFVGIADPSTAMQTGDTWTQLPATAPNAPTIGTATGGNASATVAFTAPAWNGGATITGYTATSTPGGITGTGTTSPITVSGLTNGTGYTFTVHATNSVGNSAESAASNSVTPSAAVGAVRFDAATDGLTYLGLGPDPAVTGYTVTFWAYISVNQGTYSAMFRYGNNGTSSSNTADIETDIDGVTPKVFTSGGVRTGITMSAGAWYRIAYTVDSAGTAVFYTAPATGTVDISTGSGGTVQRDSHAVGLANDGSGEFWNGRITRVRVWAAALTQSQVVAEWASTTPVVTAGLWADWPLTSASDLTDHSGNGRNLTAGSTAVTTEAGPP